MNAPCRDCPDRHEACHDHCDRYKAYKAERERIRLERQASGHIHFMNEAKDKAYRKKLNRYKRNH